MSLVASAFLLGLLGGLHCLSMCGAFIVASGGGARPAGASAGPGCQPGARRALVHLGRLLTYASLGALAGGVGAGVGSAATEAGVRGAQSTLFLLANVTLLVVAIHALRGVAGIPALERAGAVLARRLPTGALLAAAIRNRSLGSIRPLLVGVVWGFVPCALIYTSLTLSLFAGGAAAGAAVTAGLWAGTLPNLGAAGWLVGRLRRSVEARRIQLGFGLVMLVFALAGLYRMFFAPESFALRALCTFPG